MEENNAHNNKSTSKNGLHFSLKNYRDKTFTMSNSKPNALKSAMKKIGKLFGSERKKSKPKQENYDPKIPEEEEIPKLYYSAPPPKVPSFHAMSLPSTTSSAHICAACGSRSNSGVIPALHLTKVNESVFYSFTAVEEEIDSISNQEDNQQLFPINSNNSLKFIQERDTNLQEDDEVALSTTSSEVSGDYVSSCKTAPCLFNSNVKPVMRSVSCSGDVPLAPIHYESFYEPDEYYRCWTIKDFGTLANNPKMLKSCKLEFKDAQPPIEFWIGVNKSRVVYLKPHVTKENLKKFGTRFAKYGFSLGPHNSFGEDFSLETSLVEIRSMNKSHLNILESQRILHSYLVDGNLNLIVRFIPFLPKTRPVQDSELDVSVAVKCCSQFTLQKIDSYSVDYEAFQRRLLAS